MATPLLAPGVYERPEAPLRALTGVRMDVAAFVGVAPRGPARVRGALWPRSAPDEPAVRRSVACPVESWDEYVRRYGAFEGPGLLPYSVASFFEQGGRRAYVVRVVHAYGDARDDEGVAWGAVGGLAPRIAAGLPIRARRPGWDSDGVAVRLRWRRAPVVLLGRARGVLTVPADAGLREGSLLRVVLPDGSARFAFVDRTGEHPGGEWSASLVDLLPDAPASAELVTCDVEVRTPAGAVQQSWAGLGLSHRHRDAAGPRWLGSALAASDLVAPHPRWTTFDLVPTDTALVDPPDAVLAGGFADRAARGRLSGVRTLDDGLWLCARDEGSWGNGLRASLAFRTRPLSREPEGAGLLVARDFPLPSGSVLAFHVAGALVLRRVVDVTQEWSPGRRGRRLARVALDAPEPAGASERIDIVECEIEIVEARGPRPQLDRRELHQGLGFAPEHPRWIARVLLEESALVHPDEEWLEAEFDLPDGLAGAAGRDGQFRGGTDRYPDITHDDFFDPRWSPVEEGPLDGIHAVLGLDDLSLLVVPDLYSPAPLPPRSDGFEQDPFAGPEFRPCVHAEIPPPDEQPDPLAGLRLDPADRLERAEIVGWQRRVVDLAEAVRSFVALLDVPPGLAAREVLEWRARFDAQFAAAYHPWLLVGRTDDGRRDAVRVGPAAVAAGIVARTEWLSGVPFGPANALATGVVTIADPITDALHDELHPAGVNVYRRERDGVRLTAARTLSRGIDYRQLSVRRLVTMIGRTLEQQMQWSVFEPNGPALRDEVVRLVTGLLRALHRANAFTGDDEADAFFVRCDDRLNPPPIVDAGRLIAEIGVAPASPIEWILLRLDRAADGTLRVEG